MRPPLEFFVAGIPKPTPRIKATHFGKFTHVYTPKDADDWKMIVRNEARRAWNESGEVLQYLGPLRVDLTFYFPRPRAHFKSQSSAAKAANAPLILKPTAPTWHTSKPDRDNSDKAVLDALTNLGIWGDDKQACDGRIRKLYATPAGFPGCLIRISEAGETSGGTA